MLELRGVDFAYRPEAPLLSGFSLAIRRGGLSALIGPNGSGKSTVFKLACGFLKPGAGSIFLCGKPLASYSARDRAKVVAVLPQLTGGSLPFTVREVVRMGRIARRGAFEWWRQSDSEAVERLLAEFRLEDCALRPFDTLSGGERQRTMLAAALAQEPEMLLLDEPTSALDLGHKFKLMSRLKELSAGGKLTVVVITHDLELAGRFAERLILLKAGRIVADGAPLDVITPSSVKAAYDCEVAVRRGPAGEPVISFPT